MEETSVRRCRLLRRPRHQAEAAGGAGTSLILGACHLVGDTGEAKLDYALTDLSSYRPWGDLGGKDLPQWDRQVSRVIRASWYRFRATFRHEWGSYLTIALLLGLVGGLAMGSLAAARRTQSSYSALLETTNPSQIVVATAIANPAIGNGQGYNPAIVREIATELPHVTAVANATGINAEPLGPNGAPIANRFVPSPSRDPAKGVWVASTSG